MNDISLSSLSCSELHVCGRLLGKSYFFTQIKDKEFVLTYQAVFRNDCLRTLCLVIRRSGEKIKG